MDVLLGSWEFLFSPLDVCLQSYLSFGHQYTLFLSTMVCAYTAAASKLLTAELFSSPDAVTTLTALRLDDPPLAAHAAWRVSARSLRPREGEGEGAEGGQEGGWKIDKMSK